MYRARGKNGSEYMPQDWVALGLEGFGFADGPRNIAALLFHNPLNETPKMVVEVGFEPTVL
jgi:hypothetical protein